MDQMNPAPAPVSPAPKKSEGMSGVIAIIVIVVLLALGGVYYLLTSGGIMQDDGLPSAEEAQNSDDPAVQAALSQSASDELSSIEADVNATDFGEIDAATAGVGAE